MWHGIVTWKTQTPGAEILVALFDTGESFRKETINNSTIPELLAGAEILPTINIREAPAYTFNEFS